jgi:hypothetical protein
MDGKITLSLPKALPVFARGPFLGSRSIPLGATKVKKINRSKGNMSKGNIFVKKIMAGEMGESLA